MENVVWHEIKEDKNGKKYGYPKVEGDYLTVVVYEGVNYYNVLKFCKDVSKLRTLSDEENKRMGFVAKDHIFGINLIARVTAWCELPSYKPQ